MNDTTAAASSAADLTELSAEIVSAYVAHNSVPMADLPMLLQNVHAALGGLGTTPEEPRVKELKPAVPIKKSIIDDYLISLENGQRFRSLKRHLITTYGITPQDYRTKWNLPKDYPMVAPGYASARVRPWPRTSGLGESHCRDRLPRRRSRPRRPPPSRRLWLSRSPAVRSASPPSSRPRPASCKDRRSAWPGLLAKAKSRPSGRVAEPRFSRYLGKSKHRPRR